MQPNEIPVLLIPFRRPTKIKQLITALAKVQPKYIYVLADGPRPGLPEEARLCAEARRIATDIPWPCEIHTHFKDTNVGLTENVTEGIDWFFDHVEYGIILEDDCIPDPSFFTFCAVLLPYYKDNERIMHISGNNFQNGVSRSDGSYYFSHYSHSWGWATWRRAWKRHIEALSHLHREGPDAVIETLPFSDAAKLFWKKHLQKGSHWDGLWVYTTWYAKGLSILPNQNLVSNHGFDAEATHTHEPSEQANLQNIPLEKVIHPTSIAVNTEADEYTFTTMFYTQFKKKLRNKISAILKKFL